MHIRARKFFSATAAAALLTGVLIGIPTAAANAAPLSQRACTTVEGVFAAGSGQSLGDGEFAKFDQELNERINNGSVTYSTYELGTEAYGGQQYDPVPVAGWLNGGYGNAIGGFFSSGGAFDYGNSVNRGVNELDVYLDQRRDKCEDMIFVLGGYSQGAQVIGETYIERLSIADRQKIAFNILVGDPRLNLPEGRGINPPACRGVHSEWRYGKIQCDVDNGALGARDPYLESGWTSATGLWCNDEDYVCGSSKNAFINDGHGKYRDNGNGITEGAQEAASRVKRLLPAPQAADVNDEVLIIGVGTTGTDVVFTIDSTGSMGGYIEEAREYARTMATSITALRGRVALVEYRDAGDEFVSVVRSPLSADINQFTAALDAITVDGGGDIPEAVLAALMTGFNDLDWRPGATKAAVILTDAGFHNPDVATGDTIATVAKRALEIDPVNVYPVVPEALVGEYAELADATSGQVILNSGDTAAALTEALNLISARPVPLLPLTDYSGLSGEEFTFDASESYVVDSTISEFAFDFDGDGVFEVVGDSPTATYTYPGEFSGVMQVRVTAADGGLASASATVTVTDEPIPDTAIAAPENLTATVVSTTDGVSDVELNWTASDNRTAQFLYRVNGVALVLDSGTARTVRVTDVQRSAPVVFSVNGVQADGTEGAAANVILEPLDDQVEPTPPGPGDGEPDVPGPTVPTGPGGSGTEQAGAGSPTRTTGSGVHRLANSGLTDVNPVLLIGGLLIVLGSIGMVTARRWSRRGPIGR